MYNLDCCKYFGFEMRTMNSDLENLRIPKVKSENHIGANERGCVITTIITEIVLCILENLAKYITRLLPE